MINVCHPVFKTNLNVDNFLGWVFNLLEQVIKSLLKALETGQLSVSSFVTSPRSKVSER